MPSSFFCSNGTGRFSSRLTKIKISQRFFPTFVYAQRFLSLGTYLRNGNTFPANGDASTRWGGAYFSLLRSFQPSSERVPALAHCPARPYTNRSRSHGYYPVQCNRRIGALYRMLSLWFAKRMECQHERKRLHH